MKNYEESSDRLGISEEKYYPFTNILIELPKITYRKKNNEKSISELWDNFM